MKSMNTINKLLSQGNGVFLTSEATKAGISREELSRLVEKGILERFEYGVYIKPDDIGDELYSLQKRAKKIIYSHETSLFLHRLTERTPFYYSITVPTGYNPSNAMKEKCKVYSIKSDLIDLGKTKLPTGLGHEVVTYDMERTICDILRSRNKMDIQIVTEALKFYADRKDKNINKLIDYARVFKVEKLVIQYMGVLL